MINGLQHIAVIVSDLDAAKLFYGDALGLPEVPRPAAFKFGGAWFAIGNDAIHLIVQADTTQTDAPPDPGPGYFHGFSTHYAFEVDDLDELMSRLESHGYPIEVGPLRRGDGARQTYYRDPDGHVLEFFESTTEDQSDAVRLPAQDLS